MNVHQDGTTVIPMHFVVTKMDHLVALARKGIRAMEDTV